MPLEVVFRPSVGGQYAVLLERQTSAASGATVATAATAACGSLREEGA